MRQDIVARCWGSESELTTAAYNVANSSPDMPVKIEGYDDIKTLQQLKDEIITLKIKGGDKSSKLSDLLGSYSNQIMVIKEGMVMEKMNEMV